MELLALRFVLIVCTGFCIVWSIPFNTRQLYYDTWFACSREQSTLGATCGANFSSFMTFLENKLMEQQDLNDPSRCFGGKFDTDEVDFVVIGAGLAGSMVGGRLSEARNWEVLVLEAGGPAPSASQIPAMYFNYLKSPNINWNYKLLPQDNVCLDTHGICTYPRGKVMGGTATLHGMMYMRGNQADYDMLKEDGIQGWSFSEVFPYFLKSEDNKQINRPDLGIEANYHATGGPFTISRFADQPPFAYDLLKAYQQMGYNINRDLNGESQRGFMIAQATTKNGTRLNSAKAYLYANLARRDNLYVQTSARVLKIIINPMSLKAEGVLYEHFGIHKIVRVRKEVILSAGTIASPQLLMLSGIGPRKHLEEMGVGVIKDLPGVGQNLNNHVSTEIFFRIGSEENQRVLDGEAAEKFFTYRKGPLTSTGLSQVTGFLWTDHSINDPRPDLQIFHAGYMANCSKTGHAGEPIEHGHRMFSISPTVLNARSVGWVKLQDRFPESKPLIFGNILNDKHDMDVLLTGIRYVLQIANTPVMKKKQVRLEDTPLPGCQHLSFNSDDYWRCYISYRTNPENHQTGTCKMGAISDPMAVLDNNLRVIGIKNLRVADASVFPRAPSANLQGPTMMVAERAAVFIDEVWRDDCTKYWSK